MSRSHLEVNEAVAIIVKHSENMVYNRSSILAWQDPWINLLDFWLVEISVRTGELEHPELHFKEWFLYTRSPPKPLSNFILVKSGVFSKEADCLLTRWGIILKSKLLPSSGLLPPSFSPGKHFDNSWWWGKQVSCRHFEVTPSVKFLWLNWKSAGCYTK